MPQLQPRDLAARLYQHVLDQIVGIDEVPCAYRKPAVCPAPQTRQEALTQLIESLALTHAGASEQVLRGLRRRISRRRREPVPRRKRW